MYREFACLLSFALLWSITFCELNFEERPIDPCKRKCQGNRVPLVCRYNLTIEMYTTMSKACYSCPSVTEDCFRPHCIPADGGEKVVIVANRRLPGPIFEVCKGDRMIVNVINGLTTDTTSIHWHGLHQRKSPFMDGVPYITQCPILPGQTFRYQFSADIAGSYIWHSHSGDQRADGLFGGLVIREYDSENRLRGLYDVDEHVIIVNEWTRMSGPEAYVLEYQNGQVANPHTILVNGLGRFENSDFPVATFIVEKGKRYRFRLLNVGAQDCPVSVSIDGHPLLVISTDGIDVEPIEVDLIRTLPGERYDFVLTADRNIDNYWIRFQGDISCKKWNASQVAILRYKDASENEPMSQPNINFRNELRQLNPFDQGTETPGAMCIPSLNSLDPDDEALLRDPDHQFYISYDFYELDNTDYHRKNLYGYFQVDKSKRLRTLQFNHISFVMPNFPLQTQYEQIGPKQFCEVKPSNNCTIEFCACTQIIRAKLGSVVEIIVVDKGTFRTNHPMHLHGYHFRVVAMEKLSKNNEPITIDQVKALDRQGKIRRKLHAAPFKDTVIVPSAGFTIIRFLADNPGYWFFHCHFDKHASNGMGLVVKIGEHNDFQKVPDGFPKCGIREK